jgi:hypothetical protein
MRADATAAHLDGGHQGEAPPAPQGGRVYASDVPPAPPVVCIGCPSTATYSCTGFRTAPEDRPERVVASIAILLVVNGDALTMLDRLPRSVLYCTLCLCMYTMN